METIFYFLCYPKGDKTKITVIDMSENDRDEKTDFSLVNRLEWDNWNDAALYGISLAHKYNLEYEPFESRYNNTSEDSGLYL